MLTLYALVGEQIDLANELAETGELSPEAEAAIDANAEALEAKAGGYVAIWRTLDSEAEAMEAEARRLSDLARHRRNGAKALKARLVWALDTCGIQRLVTPLGKLAVCNASRPSFAVLGDAAELPTGLQKVTVALDDRAALEAWKAGTLPAGVRAAVSRYVRVS